MANELRVRNNFNGGTITDSPLTSGATTMSSAALAVLPVVDASHHIALVLDPTGSGGAPEIVYVTAHTAAATTATIVRAQEGTTARSHAAGTAWYHAPLVSDFASAGMLIGFSNYFAATDVFASTTAAALSDIDAANAAVTFTVPPSGKVLVRVTALIHGGAALLGIREGSTDVSKNYASDSASNVRVSSAHVVSGLTPGATKTYKAAIGSGSGTVVAYYGTGAGGDTRPVTMEVYALNV